MIYCQCLCRYHRRPSKVLCPCPDWSNLIWWQRQYNIWQMVLMLWLISKLLHWLDSPAKYSSLSALKHQVGEFDVAWSFPLCVHYFILRFFSFYWSPSREDISGSTCLWLCLVHHRFRRRNISVSLPVLGLFCPAFILTTSCWHAVSPPNREQTFL